MADGGRYDTAARSGRPVGTVGVPVARANRLLVAGGVVTLLGAALVLLVLMTQRGTTPSTVAATDDAPAATAPVAVEESSTPVVVSQSEGQDPVTFEIPEGHEALALTVEFQRGVAGLPSAGDRVNVYGVFTQHAGDLVEELPGVRRVLADVEVLAVSGGAFSANGGTPTVVVAVTGEDAERAIYTHAAESIYLTLVGDDGASEPTDGVSAGNLAP